MADQDTPMTLLMHELATLLRRAHEGEDPDMLLIELGANSHYVEDDDD